MKTADGKADNTIKGAYETAVRHYSQREYLTGIDIGFKYVGGHATDRLAIRFHVREKLPVSALESAERFPSEIEGFPVDVIQGSYAPGAMQPGIVPESVNRSRRFNILRPGISVGHTDVTAGTLGMFVEDIRSGKPAILSNWHVLAGSASAQRGDPILQPGPHDGGWGERDTIGMLEYTLLDENGDAAVALLNKKRKINPEILDLDIVPDSLADPQLGEEVVKSGRSTRVTHGRVDGKGRYFIHYPVGRIGIDGFIIVPKSGDEKIEISTGGDSGSIWLKAGTSTVLGIHFAGETDPSPTAEHALACYATRVFERLQIQTFRGD
jgi:hypothetical protein